MKSDVTGRNRLQLDERRAQLLALALKLFANCGYDDISIGEIAKQAGVSKGLLYHYFPSKRAFFAAAVQEAARQLLEVTEGERPGEPSEPEEIYARMDAYLDFVEQRSASYVLLMRGRLGGDHDVRAIVEQTRQAFIDRIASAIGASLGGAVPESVRIAIRGCVGFVEAASLAWLEGGGMSRPQLAEMLTQMCVATFERVLRIVSPPAGEGAE